MALCASLLAACKKPEAEAPVVAAEDVKPVKVTSVVATGRAVPQVLLVTGALTADQRSEVTPLVNGRVVEMLIDRGSIVKKDDPLMRLRDVDYRTAVESSEAALAQARARLGTGSPTNAPEVRAAAANRDAAEDTLRRTEQLAQTGAVSAADLERARASARAAREQYNSSLNAVRASLQGLRVSQVSLEQNRRNVDDSTVRAPFDGEIAERKVNVGEFVTTARAVVLLVKTDVLRLEILVPQEKLAQIHPGQKVEIRSDAYPDVPFTGEIKVLSPVVNTDTRSMVVEAQVPNTDPEHKLHPGMFVTARVALGQTTNVVVIPTTAIITEAGVSRVYVVKDGKIEERVVTVYDRAAKEVLISRGIAANERVADGQITNLFDGARVE